MEKKMDTVYYVDMERTIKKKSWMKMSFIE